MAFLHLTSSGEKSPYTGKYSSTCNTYTLAENWYIGCPILWTYQNKLFINTAGVVSEWAYQRLYKYTMESVCDRCGGGGSGARKGLSLAMFYHPQ